MENIQSDADFDKIIKSSGKLILVDFFATWCEPCSVLSPILEKVAEQFKDSVLFYKADLDNVPATAQNFKVERIPTVILFKNGEPVSGFVGLAAENAIKEWLGKAAKESNGDASSSETIEDLAKKYEEYAKNNGFQLNPDKKVVERVIKGLLANESKYGQKYCPCRRVSGNKEEDAKKICPCSWHKDEIAKDGHCFCQLYVK